MEGGWSGDGDDNGDDLPSSEAKSASRLALPEKNRGWRRLHGENWENDFCSGVFSSRGSIGASVGHQRRGEAPRRPEDTAPPQGAPGAPRAPLWSQFWHLAPSGAWIFWYFSGNFLGRPKIHFPAHNKTIQAALLKTALVRVSFVQIMQE